MKIGLISREYPPETGWGGIGTYVHHLSHALAQAGHEVHVISRSERPKEYVRRDEQMTVHRIRERKRHGAFADALARLLPISDWGYSRRVAQKVWALHREAPFDVLEAPEYLAEAFHLVRRPPAPVIVKLHTPSFLLDRLHGVRPTLRGLLLRWMERSAASRATALSAPSRSLAQLVQRAWHVEPERITVLPYPFDVDRMPAQSWPDVQPTVLYIGRFEPRKGVHVLVEAIPLVLRRVPQARFVLVGGHAEGARKAEAFARRLRQRVASLGCGDRVIFVPWQAAEALSRYRRDSHVAVVPSLYENFPNVCLEAMASGRLVVASRAGGIPEIVEDGVTGWLVPPGDPQALAGALIQALEDLSQAEAMGRAAAQRVRARFGLGRLVDEILAFYADVIRRHAVGCGGKPEATASSRRVLYTFTDRWICEDRPEAVLVHLSQRHRALQAAGVQVTWLRYQRRLAPHGESSRLGEVLRKVWEALSSLADAWQIWRQARPVIREAQIVHEWYSVYGLSGLLVAWWYRKPFVFEVDALLIEEYTQLQRVRLGRWLTWCARCVLRANLRQATRVVIRSQVMADLLTREWHVPSEKLIVLPCGVDTRKFSACTSSRSTAGPVVLFLGSLQPWHGCDVLLEAFARLRQDAPQAQLHIVGDGAMRVRLEAQAARLHLNGSVEFVGQVPHEAVPDRLANADIAVAPYPVLPVAFYFSPMKVFEYMGAGKAIVASRIGQVAELLTDQETALLVEPGSVEQLTVALLRLVRDEPLRHRLGEAARALAESYTWEQQARQLLQVYKDVLQEAERG